MSADPIADIQAALALVHATPKDRTETCTAFEDEDGVVTIYDSMGTPRLSMSREDYDVMAQRERDRIVYRGPLGNLKEVKR